MSREQQAARVNVSDDEWIEFRTLAMRKRRSIADYLGELVRRELGESKKSAKDARTENQSHLARGGPRHASDSPSRSCSRDCRGRD